MVEIVVSLQDGAELDLKTIDIGTAGDDDVIAFTVEGVIRGHDMDLTKTFGGKSLVPTEIHFRVDDE